MKYVVYRDKADEWRWRYVASNGNVIATGSEGYLKKADCLRGIEIMKESAAAPVEEEE